MKSLNARAHVFRQLRRRSDFVRAQLIPAAVADGTPAVRIYFDMTQAYFDGDVRSGQLLSTYDLSAIDEPNGENQPHQLTMEALAGPRNKRRMVAGFETLHPRYLKGISGYLFDAIDNDRARRRHGQFDLGPLIIINFLMTLMHIAEDGTGRTGEDMLVLLAAESGRTLSTSQSGYRGALEGAEYPVFYKEAAQRIFYFEVVGNFYKSLGLTMPEWSSYDFNKIAVVLSGARSTDNNNRLGWPDGLGPSIESIYKETAAGPGADAELFQPSNPYRYYAQFLASEAIYFALCLAAPSRYMPGLQSRYPSSISCCTHSLMLGLGRTYHAIADDIGGPCDKAVALIESVRRGWAVRDDCQLEAAVLKVESEDAKIGRLFRNELSSFLSIDEQTAIAFERSHGMTGDQLEKQILAGARKIRG